MRRLSPLGVAAALACRAPTIAVALDTAADTGASAGDDTGAAVEHVPAGPDVSAELFSDDELPHFALLVDEEAWAVLAAETESDRYHWVEATLVYDGVEYGPVGLRTKGENSWRPVTAKPSLKVQMDRYVEGLELLGLRELTFDAMNDDYSMMHERVAYRLYRAAGVPAARATHATLEINGEDYGLYTHVETVDRRMMRRWYDADDGPLFEQHDVDWYDEYVPYFELEYGPDDRTALQAVTDALERSDPDVALAEVQEWLDLDLFLRYWAVGAWVAQFDAYPYSSPGDDCHVFYDAGAGTLEYVPHGTDETFYYPDTDVVSNARGVLATTCLGSADCAEAFRRAVADVLDVADSVDMVGYFEMVREQVAPLVEADPRREYGTDTVEAYQSLMESMIRERREVLEEQVGLR